MCKSYIKCQNWEYKGDIQFSRMPYSYLHCKAEEINSYDVCDGNSEALTSIVYGHLAIGKLLMEDGTEHDAIIIPFYNERMMQSLVCLCEDTDGFEHALFTYIEKGKVDTCITEGDKQYVYEKYPNIKEIIGRYNRNFN